MYGEYSFPKINNTKIEKETNGTERIILIIGLINPKVHFLTKYNDIITKAIPKDIIILTNNRYNEYPNDFKAFVLKISLFR